MKEYNSNEIAMSFANIPISGYADGEIVTIEWASDAFTDKNGTDGETSRARTNDQRATVTFKLMQTSECNALLSAQFNNDLNTPNGGGVGALDIKDLQGTTELSSESAWIMQLPQSPYDREVGQREWKVRCAKLTGVVGGN